MLEIDTKRVFSYKDFDENSLGIAGGYQNNYQRIMFRSAHHDTSISAVAEFPRSHNWEYGTELWQESGRHAQTYLYLKQNQAVWAFTYFIHPKPLIKPKPIEVASQLSILRITVVPFPGYPLVESKPDLRLQPLLPNPLKSNED